MKGQIIKDVSTQVCISRDLCVVLKNPIGWWTVYIYGLQRTKASVLLEWKKVELMKRERKKTTFVRQFPFL